MKKLIVLPAVLLIFFLSGCKKSDTVTSTAKNVYPIAVLADNHYMDPSLLIADGPAFQDYLVTNGKLLAASDALMKEVIQELLQAKPNLIKRFNNMLKVYPRQQPTPCLRHRS